jgi:hypothetical protein
LVPAGSNCVPTNDIGSETCPYFSQTFSISGNSELENACHGLASASSWAVVGKY